MFKELVSSITFPCFPIPIEIQARGTDLLWISIETKDRTDGRSTRLYGEYRLPAHITLPRDTERCVQWIYEMVHGLVEHELRESIVWEGRRILDPHLPTATSLVHNPQDAVKDLFGKQG